MINISTDNRQEENSKSPILIDGKYEYRKIPLEEYQSKYIYIPLSVITDVNLDIRRIGVFSYLRVHSGLNNIIGFTISDMVEWCGGKPDRRVGGTNDKTLSVLDSLEDNGYLTYITEKSRSSYMKCEFNSAYYGEECANGYAVIYLDELDKIMNYKKENSKDGTLNNTSILLVFSYFRNKIRRRKNELNPEERTVDGIKKRRERLPEAFDGNINDIADEIGISPKTLSKIIDILEYDFRSHPWNRFLSCRIDIKQYEFVNIAQCLCEFLREVSCPCVEVRLESGSQLH
mgnify:CR=1 FL=1